MCNYVAWPRFSVLRRHEHEYGLADLSVDDTRSIGRRTESVEGTVRRILGYARPYRMIIAIFLGTLVVTSLLSVAQPLLFKRIVDDGISVGNASLVTWTALAIAGLAIADAAFGIVSRWYSARIGEGLIFDLRTQVYDHVQHQSIAFFTGRKQVR